MRTILSFISCGCALVLLVLFTGCDAGGEAGAASGIEVVATTSQVADLARNVAGEEAGVHAILAANADPHDYEPRPSDAEAVAGADLILRSGGDVDAWSEQLVAGSGSDAPEVDLLASLPAAERGGDPVDPHWWQDPRAAIVAVGVIRDALIDVNPDGARAYRANARAYIARLHRLDRAIARCMSAVPQRQRLLVSSHDALGRYAGRYGIEVAGTAIPALSTAAQPSAGETADLIRLIERRGIKAVFPEAGLNPALEEAIAQQAGATVGGELWADTLGPAGSPAATYVGAMEANTETMVAGFTGGRRSCDFGAAG